MMKSFRFAAVGDNCIDRFRPPVSKALCFVTRSVPASIEATGDIRIAGTIYADLMG